MQLLSNTGQNTRIMQRWNISKLKDEGHKALYKVKVLCTQLNKAGGGQINET